MANDTAIIEEQRMMALEQARFESKLSVHKTVTQLSEKVARKLNELIVRGHDTTAFFIAIGLTLLNDVLDIVLALIGIGDIPIISEIPGWFISGILFYFLWGKGYFNNFKVKVILWGLGFFLESIPIIDNLPMATLSVLMAWHVVRKRARKAKKDMLTLHEKTDEELETIWQEDD